MKKIISLLVCISLCGIVAGQNRYSIFKVEGDVKLLNGSSWVELYKHDDLSFKDKIRVGASSNVAILDSEISQIYYCSDAGEYRVIEIISNAKKQSDRITKLMNQQIRESYNTDMQSQYHTAGVSYRGSSETSCTRDVYAAICNIGNASQSTVIGLEKVCVNDQEFYFSVTNKSESPLYINILRLVSASPNTQLCLNIGYTEDEPYLMIAPNSTVELKQYTFYSIKNDPGRYTLFATPCRFDTQELQLLLKNEEVVTSDEKIDVLFYSL